MSDRVDERAPDRGETWRRPLAILGHGGRSVMTCRYRCGRACDHPAPNQSPNPTFADLVATTTTGGRVALSRRTVLRTGALGSLVLSLTAVGAPAVAAESPHGGRRPGGKPHPPQHGGSLTFSPVAPNRRDDIVLPPGYTYAVVIRWGDPVLPGAPEFDLHHQTAERQSQQFGYNNDFVAVLPLDQPDRALLVVNHEYTDEELMFPGFTSHAALSVEQVRTAIAAHGISVVEIERVGRTGQWRVVRSGPRPYNRRVTALSTEFVLTGPAAGSPWLRTAADPRGRTVIGTLNNCAGGVTPWGTVLSGEENVDQYFVGGDAVPAALKPRYARYGITTSTRYPSDSRRWERADERFDLARHPNEAHRFGWIVEIDPYDPRSRPRKHTALGRFKHEGATVAVAKDGRVVVYMGDDERFEYLYKFVSDKKMMPGTSPAARRHNLTLLESGTLYVATFRFTSAGEIDGSGRLPSDGAFNGTGRWIRLVSGGRSYVPGMTADEVLVFTRLAADAVGATKMDRPEDVEPNPVTGRIYAALTNNSARGVGSNPRADEANPRTANKHGHILEITEDEGDFAAETFTWSVPIVCGDPADPSTYFAGFDKRRVSPISCPDNLTFDSQGTMWIATDGSALGSNDGLFATPVTGPERGYLRQFLTVPVGAEACGPFITHDDRSLFLAVQHPGEVDGASLENPASTWPDGTIPRPAVICVWRDDGGRIGT
ncbi:MAG TPA: PhoX family phosphatase [Micromonospora sp.]